MFPNTFVAVDATVFRLPRPSKKKRPLWWKALYQGKSKFHGLKYTVAVRISDGLPVFCCGPEVASVHDKKMLDWSSFEATMDDDEYALGDKGYRGAPKIHRPFFTPRSDDEKQWNTLVESHRVVVENYFAFLKKFNIFASPFRYALTSHRQFFNVISGIVLLNMLE